MIFHNASVASVMLGDCLQSLKTLPDQSFQMCVTSPPYYGLRDYGHEGQIGLEQTPEAFVARLVEVFREVRRTLRDDGTLWLNIGDSYASFKDAKCVANSIGGGQRQAPTAGASVRSAKTFADTDIKNKDLIGIPWMLAFALRADGWYLRQDIIWHKPNPMPESVTDRCTKAHEYMFLFSKAAKYHYNNEAIKYPATTTDTAIRNRDETRLNNTPGRTKMKGLKKNSYTMANKRSVWSVQTRAYRGAHFAVFPPELIEPCILAGCPEGGVVLDPFGGSGTTAGVALKLGRNAVLCELNADFAAIMPERVASLLTHNT